VDRAGFYYFAGRSTDWLRVDSENFASAPVENILCRFTGAVMVAVYAVPDPQTGDQVMAAIEMAEGVTFDPDEMSSFLGAQRDLGTKWAPRFIRIITDMPLTANNKVNKQPLRVAAWATADDVWWQPRRGGPYQRFDSPDRAALTAEFSEHARTQLLPRS
jgi:fatty-acyl-CoA synthase